MAVEFVVFGHVEARIDGEPVDLGHVRQRCVLAALLADVNRPVPVGRLVDRVWGDRPPRRPQGTLYSYLSRLRQALAPAADEARLARRHGGYLVEADPTSVDLHRFRHLVGAARAADEVAEAAALFERALGLWRGDAFAALDTPWFHSLRETARGERFAAELDLGEARLRLGQHAGLVAELPARVRAHPLDERLAAQFMLALYRGGRPAEALAHYQRVRERLAEELGTDPSPALRTLHQRILTNDPALDPPGTPGTPVPPDSLTPRAGQAAEEPGEHGESEEPGAEDREGVRVGAEAGAAERGGTDTSPGATEAPVPPTVPVAVPRQLPPPMPLFVGRAPRLAELDKALGGEGASGGAMPLAVVGGTGGIGKTWLAVHWAHQNAAAFPDGQLYADLRGFAVAAEPVPPEDVLLSFLHALGVAAAAVPVDLPSRAALFRSLAAGKRMLIVLDNARDTGQVLPLLPGTAASTVLVTSRNQLTGLITAHGARAVPLDTLTEAEARELLVRYIGAERAAAEPGAVAALTDHCAGLPLAVSLVAARATTHPDFPLAVLAGELRSRSARLDALDAHDFTADLRAVFSTSYRALQPSAARVFGLLGQAPGPDIGLAAATALTGLTAASTRSLLRGLEAAHLLQEHAPGRYRMHELVRLYASERGEHDLTRPDREAALARLVSCYADTAHAADRLLSPQRTPIDRTPIDRTPPAVLPAPQPLADAAAAMAWFETEHACLLDIHRFAVERGRAQRRPSEGPEGTEGSGHGPGRPSPEPDGSDGWYGNAWRLAWSLDTFEWRRGRHNDRVTVLGATLATPDALGDPADRALAHRLLGRAHVPLGQHTEALDQLHRALALYAAAHDASGQAQTNLNLALAWEHRGDDRRALSHAVANLRIRRVLDEPLREAEALNAVGWYLARLGRHGYARYYCEQALALCRGLGYREGEAFTQDSLGYLAHRSGAHAQALEHYQQALALRRELGDTYEEADALACLGDVHHAMGHAAPARDAWQQALTLYRAQHRPLQASRLEGELRSSGDDQATSGRGGRGGRGGRASRA
ncbi:AfsR/SARP family transcriptional regulator [Streptomyces sp. NPDC054796]